jgi:hypothetical protein
LKVEWGLVFGIFVGIVLGPVIFDDVSVGIGVGISVGIGFSGRGLWSTKSSAKKTVPEMLHGSPSEGRSPISGVMFAHRF